MSAKETTLTRPSSRRPGVRSVPRLFWSLVSRNSREDCGVAGSLFRIPYQTTRAHAHSRRPGLPLACAFSTATCVDGWMVPFLFSFFSPILVPVCCCHLTLTCWPRCKATPPRPDQHGFQPIQTAPEQRRCDGALGPGRMRFWTLGQTSVAAVLLQFCSQVTRNVT